jgi:hypothetical protein
MTAPCGELIGSWWAAAAKVGHRKHRATPFRLGGKGVVLRGLGPKYSRKRFELGRGENGSEAKEEKFFDKISSEIEEVVKHFSKDNKRPTRGNHAKILAGTAEAQFRVSPDLPEDLSFGFLQPGKSYKAIVRFSNASSEFSADDSKPDLRGVAIRVVTELGDHDFLMWRAGLGSA